MTQTLLYCKKKKNNLPRVSFANGGVRFLQRADPWSAWVLGEDGGHKTPWAASGTDPLPDPKISFQLSPVVACVCC